MSRKTHSFLSSTPIDLRGARSGYVYIAQCEDNEQVCKVGRTTRPPHVRMKELGKGSWLQPMQVRAARFFWNAVSAEKQLHSRLEEFSRAAGGEWFDIPAAQVVGLLREWEDPYISPSRKFRPWDDEQWVEMRMEWAREKILSHSPVQTREGWRDIEKLSALGYAPASWELAERFLREQAPMDRVLWVLDAAARQGHPSAALRRTWVASLTQEDPTRRRWKESAEQFVAEKPHADYWSEEDRTTFEHEKRLWAQRPFIAWREHLHRLLSGAEQPER